MKKNWKQILFTVFLAILLWGIVTLSSNFYLSVYLPVKISLPDSTLAVSSVSNNYVIVGVQGNGWVLSGYYWQGDRYITLYPRNVVGTQNFTLREIIKKEAIFTSETNIINISPEVMFITIEEKFSKEVFVKPNYKLNFEDGYSLVSSPGVKPSKIVIYGPKSKVKILDTISTKLISLRNLNKSILKNAELELPNYIYSNTKYVTLNFDIQKIVDKPVNDIDIKIKGLPKNVELIIYPSKLSINVRGGIKILGELTKNDIQAYVLYSDALKDTTGSISPHIVLPKQIEILKITPNKIEYVIKK